MHFLNWILDQQEESGDLGLFSKIIWNDLNNGCGLRYTSPVEWSLHFTKKHPKTCERLNALLAHAYAEYANSFTPDKVEK